MLIRTHVSLRQVRYLRLKENDMPISLKYLNPTIGLVLLLGFVAQADKIPFPDALDGASIRLERLDSVIDDALIIGNGDINALIYSATDSVVIHLTKNDVWDARLETRRDPPLPTLELIKCLGESETGFPLGDNNRSYVLPEGMTWDRQDSYHAKPYPCPRQCGRLVLRVGKVSDLSAELDLHRAVVALCDGDKPLMEIRSLADRNVFLIDSPAPLDLETVSSEGIPPADSGREQAAQWIEQHIPGDLDWPGMKFAVAAASNGERHTVTIVTSLESDDVRTAALSVARKTLTENRQELIKDHESIWREFWSKSGIKIDDKLLQDTWYRSLYFLRCVSKPGVQSVGLFAGLINDTPAWHGDYHTNYNLQQTYWGAYPSNHPELAEPYDRLMFEYLPRGKWLCEQVFSYSGAYYPHVLFAYEPPNPSECKSRIGRQYLHHTWGMTIGVNGFSIQPMWWRYKYDPDIQRLREIVYPTLRQVAVFYAEFIENCEGDDKVKLGPSVSPEHWGWTKRLERNYNCAFDIAMTRYTLEAAIEAARTLGRDPQLVERFRDAIKRLPDYPLHRDGEPIVVDVEGAPPIEYNISVPATPVFPCDVVTWWSPAKEKELFARTIERLEWNGNNATFMLAISRARLSMPGTQDWLRTEIRERTRPNGTMSLNRLEPHRRFNDYGHYTEQFGAAMAVSELFLQSVDDILRLFPASKPGCRVEFVDLRTQGGFLVSGTGTSESVGPFQVRSLYGGTLRFKSPWRDIEYRRGTSVPYRKLDIDEQGIVRVRTYKEQPLYFRELR